MPGPDVSGGFARERVFRQKIQNILLALKQSVDKVYKPRIIFIASKRRKPDLPVKTWLVWRWNTEGMWQWVTEKKLERFSIECRITKTKAVTATNQRKGKYLKNQWEFKVKPS